VSDIRNISLIIIFCSIISAFGYSQKDSLTDIDIWTEIDTLELKPYQIKRLGKQADDLGDIYSAIDYYTKYVELKPKKDRYKYLVAELYKEARNYQLALEWYEKVYETVPEQFPMAMFRVAEMQIMANGEYSAAKDSLLSFKKKYKAEAKEKTTKKMLAAKIEGCEMAEEIIGAPLEIIITHLDTSINTAHVEFAPILLDDTTLLYSALKSRKIMYYTTDDEDSTFGKQPVRQMYLAHKEFDDWSGQDLMAGPFNEPGVECGNGTFSPDRSRFYFTKCIPVKKKVICSIWVSKKDSIGAWTAPEALPQPINSEEFTSTQPTIGTHPKYGLDVIYFVTDREGGKGGLDVWYTYMREKKGQIIYQKPKNCGKYINTVGTDVTPYFDTETKQMYFSSDGHPGLGGLDIFYTTGQLNKWLTPTNIGYPINNKEDDLDYTVAPSQEEGFFISNRPGGTSLKSETCCDDLYHFYHTQYIKIFVEGNLYGDCDSLEAKKAIANGTISLFLVDTASGEKMEIKKGFTNEDGSYSMKLEEGNEYVMRMSKDGYFHKEAPFSTATIEKSDTFQLKDLWLCILKDAPIIIKNVYYPFDKAHLTPETQTVIDTTIYKILVENPEIVVEISSHTDSKGSDKYNESLSQRRAESVVKYLIAKGISKKRLVAKGYGESSPLVANENEDGTDNEENRAKNRRTEFKVIGIIENASHVIYEE